MATSEWTDERLNDAFEGLRAEMAGMRADMKDMRADMKDMRRELKDEIVLTRAELKGDLHDVRSDIRLMWATMIGGCGAVIAALIATQL